MPRPYKVDNMRITTAIIALSVSLLASAQQAGDTILTLEQCQQRALANNAAIRKSSTAAQAATEVRKNAFTKYFPQVSAQGFGFRASNYVLQYNILDMLDIELIKHGIGVGVTALQPIFMGGQIVNGNKLAEIGEAVALLQAHQSEREVKLTTEKYYWELASLKATRSTLVKAIATLDTLDYQVGVAVNAGVTLKNDLLRVELLRNDFRSQLVDLDNGIKLCRMVLSQYIGGNINAPIDINAEVPEQMPPYPAALHIEASSALPNTLDYQLLVENVKAKRLEKKIELGKNLPTVVGGAGWYYHNVFNQGHNFGAIMLGINVPISGWWGGSHSMKKAELELQNAQTELSDLSEMLQINMQNKWDELTAAHRKMEIAQQAIGQSTENLRLNRVYYQAGTSTISDLLDAETIHKTALDTYASAYCNFRSAMAAYLDATAR